MQVPDLGSGASYVFTGTNGRNNVPTGSGWARKVLIVMTDGENDDTRAPGNHLCPGPSAAAVPLMSALAAYRVYVMVE